MRFNPPTSCIILSSRQVCSEQMHSSKPGALALSIRGMHQWTQTPGLACGCQPMRSSQLPFVAESLPLHVAHTPLLMYRDAPRTKNT